MDIFFSWYYQGAPFELFRSPHIAGLFAVLFLTLSLLPFRKANEVTRFKVRIILAIIIWGNEIAWHVWRTIHGHWTIQTMLPLHICSLMVWLTGIMLVTRSCRIYEFAFFLGIGGAIHALVTPDLGIYGYPHFLYWQTFTSHGLIIVSSIYMTVVEGLRPTWNSMLRAALWMNVYMLAIYFVNMAIGSNYLMVNAKPNIPSLLNYLPEWPWYILWLEAIGLFSFLLLYSPFIVKDWRIRTKLNV